MRVLEFGNNKAAAYCGRLFQFYGAEVIRVDLPTNIAYQETSLSLEQGSLDIYLHTDKKRISINYLLEQGRQLLQELAASVDIVVTDHLPAELDALVWTEFEAGLKVSITPFGLSGPYRNWRGFSPILLAMGGYTQLSGDEDREPLSLPGHYIEYQSGQYAYTAALAAHCFDNKNKKIEVSMLETVLSLSQFTSVMWNCVQQIRTRHGNRFGNIHPITLYPCKDGFVYVNVVPAFWANFVSMLEREDLLEDERFKDNEARCEHYAELDEIVSRIFAEYTMEELIEKGQRSNRLPIGKLMSLQQVLEDQHLQARCFWRDIILPEGKVKMPGSPFRERPLNVQEQGTWSPANV